MTLLERKHSCLEVITHLSLNRDLLEDYITCSVLGVRRLQGA